MTIETSQLTLRGGLVWDGLAAAASRADVTIEDDRVVRLDEPGRGTGAVLDVTGLTVLPGLIEAHAHLCFNAAPDWRPTYDADSPARMLARMAGNARAMLDAGITTVRDLGAPTSLAVELRDAIRDGLVTGPDLLVSGAPITTTGGHCYFMGGEADGTLGVRIAVRERVRAGVDWIKVMASGGNMTPGSNVFAAQYSAEELAAIVEEAHRLGRRVAAHCHGVAGIRAAVEAGVDMLEHCSFQTPAGSEHDPAVIAEIANRGIIVSPTLSVGLLRQQGTERWDRRAALVSALLDAGVQLVMSTDCGIPGVPHAALWQGMEALRLASGLTPTQVLRLATSSSARLLGLPDRGTIAPGQRADLIAVAGDPLSDLAALGRARLVVAGGAPTWLGAQ